MAKSAGGNTKLNTSQYLAGATGFFSLFSLIGIMFYGMPFFYDFWVKDFGWSRATLTSGTAVGRIVMACFAFLAGWLTDRYGPRKLIITGILLGGLGLILMGTMTSLFQFYLFNLIAGKKKVQWSSIFNQCEFYDQSHFIKDFVEFTGRTPKQYLEENSELANFVEKPTQQTL